MLSRWILDGTKKIPCHTARSFHGGGFPSPTPMGGRTGSAGRRLPMARLETNRWWWCVSWRLWGLSSKPSSLWCWRAYATWGGPGTWRSKDHSLAPWRSRQDFQLLLWLLVHNEVVAVGDVVRVHLLGAPLHLLRSNKLAELLVVVPQPHVGGGEPEEGLEELLELLHRLPNVNHLLAALVLVVDAHTNRLEEKHLWKEERESGIKEWYVFLLFTIMIRLLCLMLWTNLLRGEVNVDQGIKKTMDGHKLVKPHWPLVFGGVQEMPVQKIMTLGLRKEKVDGGTLWKPFLHLPFPLGRSYRHHLAPKIDHLRHSNYSVIQNNNQSV